MKLVFISINGLNLYGKRFSLIIIGKNIYFCQRGLHQVDGLNQQKIMLLLLHDVIYHFGIYLYMVQSMLLLILPNLRQLEFVLFNQSVLYSRILFLLSEEKLLFQLNDGILLRL
jgi:hypothetical protein